MSLGKSLGHLAAELDRLADWEGPALETGGKRLSFGQFHHQKRDAFVFTHVVECADVRMIQRRRGVGLALEPATALRARCGMGAQVFESDQTVKASVSRSVDLAHAANSQEREDLVAPETGPRRE
jgi:hypothetical protein